MEKILRKVSVSERLPSKDGIYYSDWGEVKYSIESKKFYQLTKRFEFREVLSIEYWYEEVDIQDLQEVKDLLESNNGLREDNNKYIDFWKLKTNERYEKALNNYYESKINEGVNASDISHNRLVKALKIAAGLNEEGI